MRNTSFTSRKRARGITVAGSLSILLALSAAGCGGDGGQAEDATVVSSGSVVSSDTSGVGTSKAVGDSAGASGAGAAAVQVKPMAPNGDADAGATPGGNAAAPAVKLATKVAAPADGLTTNAGVSTYGSMSRADLGIGASLNGALAFPADNAWNTDVSALPVDPRSDALIASIGLERGLHPDFGAGLYDGAPIGIPYVVVAGTQARVPVVFTAYGSESDPGPYPVPPDAPVEGERSGVPGSGGDRHVIVIDRDGNRLYELYRAFRNGDGSWSAESGAVFHLDANDVRPTARPGWTSADAAGLPVFPGLVRYDEAASGAIRHALRFTAPRTRRAYVAPATHWASSSTDPNLPPMGMRVRLKAGYAIPPHFSAETRAILQAMKTYGMLLADNGSSWYVSGAPDPRWNNDRLVSELAQVKGSDFEVVRMEGVVTP